MHLRFLILVLLSLVSRLKAELLIFELRSEIRIKIPTIGGVTCLLIAG